MYTNKRKSWRVPNTQQHPSLRAPNNEIVNINTWKAKFRHWDHHPDKTIQLQPQAVFRAAVIAETRFQSQANPYGICGGKEAPGQDYSGYFNFAHSGSLQKSQILALLLCHPRFVPERGETRLLTYKLVYCACLFCLVLTVNKRYSNGDHLKYVLSSFIRSIQQQQWHPLWEPEAT